MLGHAKIILTFLLWYVIIELYENTYGKGKSNMKKIFPLFFLLIISALMLFSCTDDTECTHSWQAATCTSPETCELCGEVRGTPTEHDIVKQSVIAPTCTENGYTLYGCSACDFTVRGDHTYKTGHSFGAWVTNDSINLCDRERVSTRVCLSCGLEEVERTSPSAHKLVHHDGMKPTCTEPGYKDYDTCSKCDYTTFEAVPAAHNYLPTVLAPTCTEEGYTTYSCDGCGDSYRQDLQDPTGHTMGAWYQESDATTTSDGEMRSSCLNCSYFETKGLTVVATGNFGAGSTATDSVIYTLYDNGTLKISGSGATYNCGWNGANQPFISYRDQITKVVIGEGITENSGGDFANLSSLTAVEFPTTFKKINTNAFMDSFKSGIDTVTVPESVTYVGCFIFGPFSTGNAVFTNVIFENPDTVFYTNPSNTANELKIFNGGKFNSSITLYSYGASNNVSAYAAKIGAEYVDLNSRIAGSVDNLSYEYFEGTLTLSAKSGAESATLPTTSPWLNYVERELITSIVVGEGITEIPESYFKDYTALTSVTLSDTVDVIRTGAFSTSALNSTPLSVQFPSGVSTVEAPVFGNRTAVTVSAFSGSAADEYEEQGVTVNILRVFRLLLLGNSLSLDAADNSGGGTSSMLYDIIKSMLGENSYVEIGTLYSGARTAAWHATMARDEVASYQFSVISDDTDGVWSVISNSCTSLFGLSYSDWDAVTIQPYGNETLTGVDDTTTGIKDSYKDDCFLELSASLPFLLDYIHEKSPNSEVYYYLTWASNTSASLNAGQSAYTTMIDVAITAAALEGDSGSFSGIIPVGTAIQNARSTYLSLLNYTASSADTQKNLQRDNVHLSLSVGRYIAALTFAEFLVPDGLRVDGYELPAMDASAAVGELPKGYNTVCRLAVIEAVKSADKSGSAKYKPTTIYGYETDPAAKHADAIRGMSFAGLKAIDLSSLIAAITEIASDGAPSGTVISVAIGQTPSFGADPKSFTATVTVSYGYTTTTVTVSGTVST